MYSLRASVDEVDCDVTVLVLGDELISVGDTMLVLAGLLVTPPAAVDVPEELPATAVEEDIAGLAVVDSELDACVPLTVDVSRRMDVQMSQCN